MTGAIFIFIVVYLLAGIQVALAVDTKQMKEPVPYGEFPSMFTIEQIRATVFFFMVLAGPFYFVKQAVRILWRRAVKG